MSIKKVGAKGIYWCSFYPAPGAPRVRQSLHTTDKAEAQRAEARLKLEHEEKVKKREEGGITLGEAYKHAWRVRDTWRSAKSPETLHSVYGYVVAYFGEDAPLSSLDADTIITYGQDMKDLGLAAGTINTRLCMISTLFTEAIRFKKYSGLKPHFDRYKVKNGRRRLVSTQEEELMINLLRAHNTTPSNTMADLVEVLADTGMRLSEGMGINPTNINREAKVVLILDTKNGDDRIVPLTDRALAVLTRRAHIVPMFSPLTTHTADYWWALMRKKMGLSGEEEFVIHALRHTFASTLANAGVDAFRIQKVMGHKTIATTEKYVKVASSSLTGLAEIMTNRTCPKVSPKAAQKTTLGSLLGVGVSGISTSYAEVTPKVEYHESYQCGAGAAHRGDGRRCLYNNETYSYTLSVNGDTDE